MPDNRILATIQALGPSFELADEMARDAQLARIADANPDMTDREIVEQLNTESPISDVAKIRQFLTAGRAIFTIAGKSDRYTFKITRKDPEVGSTYTQAAYFVSILTGPDNTQDYTYMGLLHVQDGAVRVTRKSTYRQDSKPVVALNWALGRIWRGQDLAPSGRFYHVGRCGRCGRALTVPSSIETGLGPECAGRLGE